MYTFSIEYEPHNLTLISDANDLNGHCFHIKHLKTDGIHDLTFKTDWCFFLNVASVLEENRMITKLKWGGWDNEEHESASEKY